MAARNKDKTVGGSNFTLVAPIVEGVITLADKMIFDMTINSNIGMLLLGKAGKSVKLSQEMNSPELSAWLEAHATDTESKDADSDNYEDGEETSVSTASAPSLFFLTVGGKNGRTGKLQAWMGTGSLALGDGTLEYNKSMQREVPLTPQEWAGATDLAIPLDLWAAAVKKDGTTAYFDTTTPVPAFPTTLALGKASKELWLKAKA